MLKVREQEFTSKGHIDIPLAIYSLRNWAAVEVGEVVDHSNDKCHD